MDTPKTKKETTELIGGPICGASVVWPSNAVKTWVKFDLRQIIGLDDDYNEIKEGNCVGKAIYAFKVEYGKGVFTGEIEYTSEPQKL